MGTFWDRFAWAYDLFERTNRQAVEGIRDYVAALVPEGCRMLECAAGTGAISLAAAPRAGQVLCTDLSQPMLDRAAAKARRLGLTNVGFARRDLFCLPDPDGRYDVVVAANVLHLLSDPAPAVAELWRVTAPGGLLVLPTFLQGEARMGFHVLVTLYRILGFRPKHLFTRETYRTFIQDLGLPVRTVAVVPGRMPAGMAVLVKPAM